MSRCLIALVALGAALGRARVAHAEQPPPAGSGTAGGALLGGEIVALGETAFSVRPLWAYALGTVAGAAAGGVGGYVVETRAKRDASLYLFAAGVGLLIPTVIWVGNAHAPRAASSTQAFWRSWSTPVPARATVMSDDDPPWETVSVESRPGWAFGVSLLSGRF